MVLFRCGQPLIIGQSIQYVKERNQDNLCDRYSLMIVAAVVYIGLTVRQNIHPFWSNTK